MKKINVYAEKVQVKATMTFIIYDVSKTKSCYMVACKVNLAMTHILYLTWCLKF